MDKKINVLVVPSDHWGCGLYRSVSPHVQLDKLYGDEFNVEINYEPNFYDFHSFDKYDIIHMHKGLIGDMDLFWRFLDYCKANKIVTIIDMDDNWEVGPQHPLYRQNKEMKIAEKLVENLKRCDYATTTTEIFAKKMRKYAKNVVVFPNAVDPTEEQYQPIKNPSDRIRFGFVMGSSHEKDMEQFKGVFENLGKDILDKIQIVLCGFDLRGTCTLVGEDGKPVGERPIKPQESVWSSYERTCTGDYKLCSPQYEAFLKKYLVQVQWPLVDKEPYRREWTKDLNEFARHYRNVDVLLAPLDTNEFNEVKSELKLIEGGFTKTAVICTNYGPYTIGTESLFQKGGIINEKGNCILIDPTKKHKEWAKAIKKLVEKPELITLLQNNLNAHVSELYDIRKVTAKRAEWYKSIVKK